jgi:hypothetical protein
MFCDSNSFKPRAQHFFNVKERPIEIRRKEWRQEEMSRRRELFLSITLISSLHIKIYNFLKNKIFLLTKSE